MKSKKIIKKGFKLLLFSLAFGGLLQAISIFSSSMARKHEFNEKVRKMYYPESTVRIEPNTFFGFFQNPKNLKLPKDVKQLIYEKFGKKQYLEFVSLYNRDPIRVKGAVQKRIANTIEEVRNQIKISKDFDFTQSFLSYPRAMVFLLILIFIKGLLQEYTLKLTDRKNEIQREKESHEAELRSKESLKKDLKEALELPENNLAEIKEKKDKLTILNEKIASEEIQKIINGLENDEKEINENWEKCEAEKAILYDKYYPIKENAVKQIQAKIEILKKNLFKFKRIKSKIREYINELEEKMKKVELQENHRKEIKEIIKDQDSGMSHEPF